MLLRSLIVFFVLAVALTSTTANITYILDREGHLTEMPSSHGGRNCTRAGFMCDGCSESYTCYQMPNGTWVKQFVQDCHASKTTCFESTGTCRRGFNERCHVDPTQFVCNQPGVFPDPFVCHSYHICIPSADGSRLVDSRVNCSMGFRFDPATKLCSSKYTGNCASPVPECTRGVSQGGIARNSQLYYQCLEALGVDNEPVFVPRLFQCPHNQKFLVDGCHDVDEEYGVRGNVCSKAGKFYRPSCYDFSDCKQEGGLAVKMSCPMHIVFDPHRVTCVNANFELCPYLL